MLKKPKIMASGPITAWQIEREKVEVVTDFLFLGSKITADGDHSHKIKRRLLLGRKTMTNLDSILKIETSFGQQRATSSGLRSSQWSHSVVRTGP